jgi:branched-chain amino acid aminotransferase
MRRFLMERLRAVSYKLQERVCRISDLEIADEIFLTNAVRGIRMVKKFKGRELGDRLSKQLREKNSVWLIEEKSSTGLA